LGFLDESRHMPGFFVMALFSNFVAIDYKIKWNDLFFLAKLTLLRRKEHANLIPTCKMAYITLKSALGF
jgi:hypothetical protein